MQRRPLPSELGNWQSDGNMFLWIYGNSISGRCPPSSPAASYRRQPLVRHHRQRWQFVAHDGARKKTLVRCEAAGNRCEGASAADLVSPATAFYFTMADEEVEEASPRWLWTATARVEKRRQKARQKAKKAAEGGGRGRRRWRGGRRRGAGGDGDGDGGGDEEGEGGEKSAAQKKREAKKRAAARKKELEAALTARATAARTARLRRAAAAVARG